MRGSVGLYAPLVCFLLAGCTTLPLFENFGGRSPAQAHAQRLTEVQLSDLSSSGPMKLQNAQLLLNNERAFQNKLNLVKNAESEIRLVYLKYDDDITGSAFTEALLAASKDRNLKVKVLVDFWTNYDRLDFFAYLEKASEGNIQVRFYGLPSEQTLRGALYETAACEPTKDGTPETCFLPSQTTWFSKLYLAGLYSRNRTVMRVAKEVASAFRVAGDPKVQTALADRILESDFDADVESGEDLTLALQAAGSPLGPLVDAGLGGAIFSASNGKYFQNTTDLSKQRLLLVDGFRFQLGGRDIEDSQNMTRTESDITTENVDFFGESAAVLNMQGAFDRLFNFSPMVGGLETARTLVPNDYVANLPAFQKSLGLCLLARKTTATDLENCVTTNLPKMEAFESFETRLATVERAVKENAKLYAAPTQLPSPNTEVFPATDLASLTSYYIENLAFTKRDPATRLYDPITQDATETGKYLHFVWAKGLENTCAAAETSKARKQVIISAQTLLLPASLLQTMANMLGGPWKCRNVDITLITNPTSLNQQTMASAFSRFQLRALLRYSQAHPTGATLKFFERRSTNQVDPVLSQGNITVLGDDLLVGSADGTVRSYTSDASGALYLRNAFGAAKSFATAVQTMIEEKQLTDRTEYYATATDEQLQRESTQALEAVLPKATNDQDAAALASSLTQTTQNLLESVTTMDPHLQRSRSPASADNTPVLEYGQRYDGLWKAF